MIGNFYKFIYKYKYFITSFILFIILTIIFYYIIPYWNNIPSYKIPKNNILNKISYSVPYKNPQELIHFV